MVFGYDSFCTRVKRLSKHKLNHIIYASWSNNTFRILFLYFLFDMLFLPLLSYYFFLNILSFIFVFVYFYTRKCGFAMSDNGFFYVRFSHFGYKAKEYYEISFDNVKYLSVRKFLFMNFIKMSFISDTGKFRKIRVYYSNSGIGLKYTLQGIGGKVIFDKLIEMQKVLDRGDY